MNTRGMGAGIVFVLLIFFAGWFVGCTLENAIAAPALSRTQEQKACAGVPAPAARWAHIVNRYWSRWLARNGRRLTVAQLHHALLIVWRESNGQPREVNAFSGCSGLFQLLPAFSRGHFDLLDPVTNASLAGQLFVRRGWAPWRLTAY